MISPNNQNREGLFRAVLATGAPRATLQRLVHLSMRDRSSGSPDAEPARKAWASMARVLDASRYRNQGLQRNGHFAESIPAA